MVMVLRLSVATFGLCVACAGAGSGVTVTTAEGRPLAELVGRSLSINGQPVVERDAAPLGALELERQAQLPDGSYWYDPISGALGLWGGPTLEFAKPALEFAALPEMASGGGTGVFVNGRELHPEDRARVSGLVGRQIPLGRYWMDSEGNVGPEGGGTLMNLFAELERQGGTVPQLGAGVRERP